MSQLDFFSNLKTMTVSRYDFSGLYAVANGAIRISLLPATGHLTCRKYKRAQPWMVTT